MKIDLNDPRITAFALGELTGADAIEMARAVRSDGRVRKVVEEVRETALLLGDALSPGGAELLTRGQREVIRSAGAGPVIGDIASARVPFWKKPAVVATGAAAAVAAALYMVAGSGPSGDNTTAGRDPEWSWAQVDTRDLTAPVPADAGAQEAAGTADAVRAVSTAVSDDTQGFRTAVRQRIESSEMKAAEEMPDLEAPGWQDVSVVGNIPVPMASGAASWPWVRRYIAEAGKLPPRKAVRIEEMVNHFSYRKPDMARHGGLAADMELCQNPWNPRTHLLAVHLQAQPGADVGSLRAALVANPDRVSKLRLLGYANPVATPAGGQPALASRTRGNYVIYEIQTGPDRAAAQDAPLVTLTLGGDDVLAAEQPKSWIHASADMRFASAVAAAGMMLSDYPAQGELDAARLGSLCDLIEQSDGPDMPAERKEALGLVRKAIGIAGRGPDPQKITR